MTPTEDAVLFELPVDPEVPKCRRVGCVRVGTSRTVLTGRGRRWELFHCEEHAEDGLQVGTALGFGTVQQPRTTSMTTVSRRHELPQAS